MSEDAASNAGLQRVGVRPEPVIIPMEEQHIDSVTRLWKERFGAPDDLIDAWLTDVLKEEMPTEGFVASDGGNVLGFGIAAVADPDYIQDYIDHPDVEVEVWPKTGLLHMLCVDKHHEGEGIGSRLIEKRLEYLAMQDVGGVVGVSWHRENYRDSRPLFEKFGFEAAAVTHDFYSTINDPEVHCVDCEGTCECGATVFKLSLGGGE